MVSLCNASRRLFILSSSTLTWLPSCYCFIWRCNPSLPTFCRVGDDIFQSTIRSDLSHNILSLLGWSGLNKCKDYFKELASIIDLRCSLAGSQRIGLYIRFWPMNCQYAIRCRLQLADLCSES